jgi:general nucleoside transport system ATP-binding protein
MTALDGASIAAQRGTVHALLGENGAGKTTLMRIAFGMTQPDSGRFLLHGRPVIWQSPADAIAAGIGMVHQHFTLVPAMTVAENVDLGISKGSQWRFDRQAAEARVRALSTASGLEIDPRARVSELSIASQQRVEILKALSREARILILDEPTAVLAPPEIDELLRWLQTYAGGGGTAILITHKLREALAVADDVTILRRGCSVFIAKRATANEHSLTQAMIGEQVDRPSKPAVGPVSPPPLRTDPVAKLENVSATDHEHREAIRATVAVYPGEILGIAGVEGAGQHALLRVLAGRIEPISGRLTRPSKVGFIPEDRHRDGLILNFSLTENVALRGAGERRGRMSWSGIRRQTATLVEAYDIRASGVSAPARTLSGGNQQRLVLARELDEDPVLVIAENPTRGLDVRAAADVYGRLRAVRDGGGAVVLYSSDLDEVIALADRVLAVHAGTVHEVPPEKDLVGRAMLGLA